MGYLANFIVYTLAMVGVIVVALLVFRNATSIGGTKSSKYLKVIDAMSLGQRKTLYIVSAGREKFLIAGDVDKTSLISKLEIQDSEQVLMNTNDAHEIAINSTASKPYSSVLKNLASKIKER